MLYFFTCEHKENFLGFTEKALVRVLHIIHHYPDHSAPYAEDIEIYSKEFDRDAFLSWRSEVENKFNNDPTLLPFKVRLDGNFKCSFSATSDEAALKLFCL